MADEAPATVELPEDVQEKLSRLAAYEAHDLDPEHLDILKKDWMRLTEEANKWAEREKEPKPVAKEKPSVDAKGDLQEKVRAEVMKAIPELQKLNGFDELNKKLDDILSKTQQRDVDTVHESLVEAAKSLVTELQLDLSTKEGREVAEDLGDLIEKTVFADRRLLERYTKGDKTVAHDALKKVQSSALVRSMSAAPRKKVAPHKFTSFSAEGDASAASLATITDKLPERNRFRAIAERTHGLVFGNK